jgi:biotin carboxyl carrier protein
MKKSNYQVEVNEMYKFSISPEDAGTLDFVKVDENNFHILQGNKSFEAELVEADYQNKTLHLKINGNRFSVKIADQYDQLVEKMGLSAVVSSKVKDIKAPMPGLVLDINVAAGQEVNKGDKLVILEAMKMENVIKSEGEGVVKEIHVEKGATVDKGQMLIEMA